MTKEEATAILNRRDENYFGGVKDGMARLDGSFTREEIEAALFLLTPSVPQMLVVHHEDDTPENRAAAEKALHAKGVTLVRHQSAFNIMDNRVMLRSDGYAP